MTLWQGKSRRSKTGRRIRYARKKRRFEMGRGQDLTTLGEPRLKHIRTRGNNKKIRAISTNIVFVTNPKTNKTMKTEIIRVLENPANIHYIRRNIINKGAVIDTKLGKARITSRPGQTGIANAVLIPGGLSK